MNQRKKLQVFVSSTFADLRAERQAAVEAILTAGHIPAGMELFAAGDESQMQVIRRWIEESDVYLLILGGRYGSIEPSSGKSYIHLEYEHAVSQSKPLFAVVIDENYKEERVKQMGSLAIETEHSAELRKFREQVLSKISRFWRDTKDIRLAVLETLPEFERRAELAGWVPGSDVDMSKLAQEIARLTKENADLRAELSRQTTAASPAMYSGLSFDEFYALLAAVPIDEAKLEADDQKRLAEIAKAFGDPVTGLVHAFFMIPPRLVQKQALPGPRQEIGAKLAEFDLCQPVGISSTLKPMYGITPLGHHFFMRLLVAKNGAKVQSLRDRAS